MEQNKNDLSKESKPEESTSDKAKIKKPTIAIIGLVLLVCTLLIFGASLIYIKYKDEDKKDDDVIVMNLDHSLDRFKSEEDFKDYLAGVEDSGISQYWGGGIERNAVALEDSTDQAIDSETIASPSAEVSKGDGTSDEDRFSETNVQVSGIDEPDIVKTDGKNIYLSKDRPVYYTMEVWCEEGADCDPGSTRETNKTKVIKAIPPDEMKISKEIEMDGELLLGDKILVIIGNEKIKAYDISDPADPQEKWEYKKEDDIYFETSRLFDNNLYLVARKYINRSSPCPVPVLEGASDVKIACDDIYHPSIPVPTDVTYNILKIDITNGELKAKESFIGSQGQSVVYMSKSNLYISYTYGENQFEFLYNALMEFGDEVLPSRIMDKIKKLEDYDISTQAKYTEMEKIIEDYSLELDKDEYDKVEEKMEEKMKDYVKKHKREMSTTGIVKVDLDSLKVKANGGVPGSPLNQFSMDEYKGDLRIATNINPSVYGFGVGVGSEESVNDVYVLSDELKIRGNVKDLGKDERIYSVRFIGDKGYVVTFKQTDPFYVLDLSNPDKPEKKGELKIPGFSSYLHPLKENLILGIGQEDWKLKLSIFDVSDVSNPKEVAKKTLEDWGSEAQWNHHAFLQDDKYEIFFLPGGQKGYIFSYKDNKIEKVKEVEDIGANRALFINDYLYVISSYNIKVLSEKDWKEVKTFQYAEKPENPYPMDDTETVMPVDVEEGSTPSVRTDPDDNE